MKWSIFLVLFSIFMLINTCNPEPGVKREKVAVEAKKEEKVKNARIDEGWQKIEERRRENIKIREIAEDLQAIFDYEKGL